ncbi:MAG TPA: hypothetical protein PLR37_17805 [Candidatus Accumulibacter phosphatis]|uniref:hypothetical protein n=1 Tax=Accumulibacter sp. TaxID=2053492 RepID=UPI00258DF66D|nr:hypothetical protein [Accumulibacter sp.]HRF13939.1 hypothetical protein [Candidatus Accumulibacter phosphatis]
MRKVASVNAGMVAGGDCGQCSGLDEESIGEHGGNEACCRKETERYRKHYSVTVDTLPTWFPFPDVDLDCWILLTQTTGNKKATFESGLSA